LFHIRNYELSSLEYQLNKRRKMFTEYPTTLPMESLLTPAVESKTTERNEVAQTPAGGDSRAASTQSQRDVWFARASAAMPYGVSSNFRYWGEKETMVIARGKGSRVWDVDGKSYIDYRLGYGPVILGHAYDAVNEAVIQAMNDGNVFALTNTHEIKAAERLKRMTKTDKVRFTNSGAESTMHTLRIARAHTNREKYIKFEGSYHGAHDYAMWSTPSAPLGALGSRKSPIPVASSSGIPDNIRQHVIVLPYNDLEMLEKTVRARYHEIAAIFVEPMMGNNAAVMPTRGFLETIRRMCDEFGIVMVMDEVKTGFRMAKGGAQEYFGIQSDLVCYAKSMGNGFPVGAIAGKEEFMMTIEPGAVGQGGTYTGNIVSSAAVEATLRVMEEQPVFETMNTRGSRLMHGIDEILNRNDIAHVMTGVPTMFGVLLGIEDASNLDFRKVKREADSALSDAICAGLRHYGVMPDPEFFEPWFMSYSHSEQDVDETLEIFDRVVSQVMRTSA
jgi:glutamate-1-semialdehyde 2,1-aminomutase